jgi:hypothetical protein
MQSSQSHGEPRILRCPHCGAPLEAPPLALTTQCRYCGHQVKLADPNVPRPSYPAAPLPRPAPARTPLVLGLGLSVVLSAAGAVIGYLALSTSPERADEPQAPAANKPVVPATVSAAPAAKPSAKPREARYALRSLLGIDATVDIDASRAHLRALFPSIESTQIAGQLRYIVPLDHPWFGEAQLSWKNERRGRLATVGFRPPLGNDKLQNQKQIADCLGQGLGKPEVRETDHLAGELSYFWSKAFPKAWANLYSGYLWLAFEDPKGVAPVTLSQVVRTLDRCGSGQGG